MALEDIENLKERLKKNPNSKLFVPLAEEYRKAEMFDEAIEVLKQGLELQPSYMSARVALGKIYLEKEMLEEAKSEFEEVIKAIPDNLFAHKKLAEIYKDMGNPISALNQYQTVISLNPLDDEAQISMEAIADAAEAAKAEKAAEADALEEKKREDALAAEKAKEDLIEGEVPENVPESGMQGEVIDAVEQYSESEAASVEDTSHGKDSLVKDLVRDSDKNLGKEFEHFKNTIESDVKPTVEKVNEKQNETASDGKRETQMFYGGDSPAGIHRPEKKDETRRSILPDDEEFLGKPVEEESILPDDEEYLGRPAPVAEESSEDKVLFGESVKGEYMLPIEEALPGRPTPVEGKSPEDKVIFGETETVISKSQGDDAVIEEAAPVESASQEDLATSAEAFQEEEGSHEGIEEDIKVTRPVQRPDDILSEIRLAEVMVQKSQFADAVRHYTGLMEKYPDDKRILQKLQELRVYLKMLGKDKEEVINKLQLFLNRIMVRKEQYGV